MTDQSPEQLQAFRENVFPKLIARGVEPPQPNSATEQVMFQRWLRGKEKLEASSKQP